MKLVQKKERKMMLRAVVFYGGIVVSLTCAAYHWGTEGFKIKVSTFDNYNIIFTVLAGIHLVLY
ncbi:MAG: hypothetical protein ABIN67_04415 [Ferruginibacter sp.]